MVDAVDINSSVVKDAEHLIASIYMVFLLMTDFSRDYNIFKSSRVRPMYAYF